MLPQHNSMLTRWFQKPKPHRAAAPHSDLFKSWRLLAATSCPDRMTIRGRASNIVASSVPPSRRDDRKNHANKYDQGGDLNPDEPAKLSKNDFDTIAPRGRQGIPDGLDAVRCGSEPPLDPVRPVVKRKPDENPRQDSGDHPETMHLGVMFEPRIVPTRAIHFSPACLAARSRQLNFGHRGFGRRERSRVNLRRPQWLRGSLEIDFLADAGD